MDLSGLIEAIKGHAWPIVAAVVIGALVRAVKSDRIPVNVPSRFRPLLALGLGLASGSCDAIVRGTAWQEALGLGLLSSFIAMGGHDVLIEALRGGREVSGPPAGGAAALVVTVVAGLALTGCGSTLRDAADALNAANVVVTAAEPCMVDLHDRELAACTEDLCRADVTARWAPVADALDVLHGAWCALKPESEGCAR